MKKVFTSCEATSAVMVDSGRGLSGLNFLVSPTLPYCRICPESYESVSLAEKVSFCSSGIKPDFAAS